MLSRSAGRVLKSISCGVVFGLTLTGYAQKGAGPTDAQLQADAQKQLHGKQFQNIQVHVADGIVTLTGHVDRLGDKLDAEKRINKMHEASSINDQIAVDTTANVSDEQLFQKLAKQLAYDREGYGTLPFNAITVQIHDGVVTLGGEVVEPVDKESAVNIVENTPGVRGLVDHLQVAPVSPNDWQLRRALFRAVYGAPQLNRYAIDPAKPIRIVVVNGHATLVGGVQSKADREVAGIRANSVPGVFSVTNDLQVQGQGPER